MMVKLQHACGHSGYKNIHQAGEKSSAAWQAQLEAGLCRACWLKSNPPSFVAVRLSLFGDFCFPIKELLMENGYYFQGKRWRKDVASAAVLQRECAWLTGQGFAVREFQP